MIMFVLHQQQSTKHFAYLLWSNTTTTTTLRTFSLVHKRPPWSSCFVCFPTPLITHNSMVQENSIIEAPIIQKDFLFLLSAPQQQQQQQQQHDVKSRNPIAAYIPGSNNSIGTTSPSVPLVVPVSSATSFLPIRTRYYSSTISPFNQLSSSSSQSQSRHFSRWGDISPTISCWTSSAITTNSNSISLYSDDTTATTTTTKTGGGGGGSWIMMIGGNNRLYQCQQVRWKRRDGNKAFHEERKPNKKQLKRYHRQLKAQQYQQQGRHSPPGSKAGPKRTEAEEMRQAFLQEGYESSSSSSSILDDKNSTTTKGGKLLEDEYGKNDAIIDDLFGNSRYLASHPTPEPVYLGHMHRHYYNRVADQMDKYRRQRLDDGRGGEGGAPAVETSKLKHDVVGGSDNRKHTTTRTTSQLPSDTAISRVLRAYRDQKGTRLKPIGLVVAMEHLVQDLGVPTFGWGEKTYTTLLTCCRTPQEGRRVLDMIRSHGLPVTGYSWSILVDIYAKVGDYQGCTKVLEEMIREGVTPTLPAYTSLLAACYKVCNDGRIAHSIRANAGKVGWDKWQEMRIVGVNPDVMAYGAILRLLAAQGRPERAINVLDEMPFMQVKPTTLCFTSALRAVAKSHAISIRYERGSSPRNRRREYLTLHHGRMARNILIMAESADIEQDEGFVASLIMCAGSAGDLATAKAIYVASQVRKLDQFRTIGPNEHLARLRGEGGPSSQDNSLFTSLLGQTHSAGSSLPAELSDKSLTSFNQHQKSTKPKAMPPSFGEREYGKDARVLSAILHACSTSVDQHGMGTIWQGRENLGYLCENSLRLIAARKVPRYHDNSIPGESRTAGLTWKREFFEEDYRKGKRQNRKFDAIEVVDDANTSLDDLDEEFSKIYLEEGGQLKEEFRPDRPDDIWRMKYGDKDEALAFAAGESGSLAIDDGNKGLVSGTLLGSGDASALTNEEQDKALPERGDGTDDDDIWKLLFRENDQSEQIPSVPNGRSKLRFRGFSQRKYEEDEISFDVENSKSKPDFTDRIRDLNSIHSLDQTDDAEMRGKSGTAVPTQQHILTDYESKIRSTLPQQSPPTTTEIDDKEFASFFRELKEEFASFGGDQVTEEEAREVYVALRDEDEDAFNALLDAGDVDPASVPDGDEAKNALIRSKFSDNDITREEEFMVETNEHAPTSGRRRRRKTATSASSREPSSYVRTITVDPSPFDENDTTMENIDSNHSALVDTHQSDLLEYANDEIDGRTVASYGEDFAGNPQLENLRELLPTFSDKRLRRILRVFAANLGDPPLLELVPLVRERMPDYITNTWLKQMANLTSRFVMNKAKQDSLVNKPFLNAALEVQTSMGTLDRALEFYETEFSKHGVEPTGYSDRMVLDMFLKNNRLSRALFFKQKLEAQGRQLDLLSYGSLIEYCSRRNQLGSSMLLLKECLSVHGMPPPEAALANLRILCRQSDPVGEMGITKIIGDDPIAWFKEGEAKLKRETSKKGNRNVRLPRNRLVHL